MISCFGREHQSKGKVLTGQEIGERFPVVRREVERTDAITFHHFFLDQEFTPAIPRRSALGFATPEIAHDFQLRLEPIEREILLTILPDEPANVSRRDQAELNQSAGNK